MSPKTARQKAERARVEAARPPSTVSEYAALANSKARKPARSRTSRPAIDAEQVIEMDAAGRSQREIAELLGTSKSTVQRVLKQSGRQAMTANIG